MKTQSIFSASCRTLILSLALVAFAPLFSWAQATPNPPGQISYQGFLVDANGIPLATNAPKNYTVIFRIYNQLQSDTNSPLWAEQQVVTVDRGYFSVMLGQGSAAGSQPNTNNLTRLFTGPDASDRFLGLTVEGVQGGDAEIQPRLRLLAGPYALLAANANALVNGAGQQLINTFGTFVGVNKGGANPNSELDVNGKVTATSFAGNGASLTGINANNISAGTLDATKLPNTVALLNANQTFTGQPTFANGLTGQADSVFKNRLGIGGNPTAKLTVAGSGFFGNDAGSLATAAGTGVRVFYDSPSGQGQVYGYDYGNGVPKDLILQQPGGGLGLRTSTISEPGCISFGTLSHLNDQPVYLRGGTDHNHGLAYRSSFGNISFFFFSNTINVDGPALYGYSGGVLGTSQGGSEAWALRWDRSGNVYTWGSVNPSSDRKLKEHFAEVEERDILSKVVAMPVTTWNFKWESSVKHIGPMAQDFYGAFGVGADDKHISVLDASGVALAAIKGLNQVVQEKETEIQELRREVQELRGLVQGLAKNKATSGQ
jgi:hypothetical protein